MSDKVLNTTNRNVLIKTSDNQIIRGTVNLLSDSAPMDRVSDLMIKGQNKFLVMFNATVQGQKDAVIMVNKNQIIWVMEEKAGSM